MKACPYRKDFYLKLGDDQAKVLAQQKEWVAGFENVVSNISVFYETGGFNSI